MMLVSEAVSQTGSLTSAIVLIVAAVCVVALGRWLAGRP